MKRKTIALVLILLVLTTKPAYAETDFDSVVPEDLKQEELVEAYNELRDSYNALYKLYLKELLEGGEDDPTGTEGESETTSSENSGSLVTVKLANKTTSKGKYDSEYYVNFVFEITNGYDKDIKGIQGEATFKDLFGEEIITIGTDFTGKTFVHGMTGIVSDLYFDCNQFIDRHMKLYNTDYTDLKFEYIPTMIVFEDGTSIEF